MLNRVDAQGNQKIMMLPKKYFVDGVEVSEGCGWRILKLSIDI